MAEFFYGLFLLACIVFTLLLPLWGQLLTELPDSLRECYNKNKWIYIITDCYYDYDKFKWKFQKNLRMSKDGMISQVWHSYYDADSCFGLKKGDWLTLPFEDFMRSINAVYKINTLVGNLSTTYHVQVDSCGNPIFPQCNGLYFVNTEVMNKYMNSTNAIHGYYNRNNKNFNTPTTEIMPYNKCNCRCQHQKFNSDMTVEIVQDKLNSPHAKMLNPGRNNYLN